MRIAKILKTAAILAAFAIPAQAAEGDWLLRVRGIGVVPDEKSSVSVGGNAQVEDNIVPEIDISYFFTNNIALELIAATTKHHVTHSSGADLGSAWLLPPTLTAQYHFNPEGMIRPYVGAGVNYTIFYNVHDGAFPGTSYDNNFGWALQLGTDIALPNSPVFLNVDLKKIFLSTKWKSANPAVNASVDLDPWIIGLGVGMKL